MQGESLSKRRQAVLALVIEEYTATAQPVGSKTVVDAYALKVSPATIRNEMKSLEDQGYLTHPHTSAGRVPTESGYRYFVQHLLPDRTLSPDEQRLIRHQFHQARREMDQWTRLAAAVLAHRARMAALVTPLQVDRCQFKHLELVEVRHGIVLLVLVLSHGMVKQQMLHVDPDMSQEDLSTLSNELNHLLVGKELGEIELQAPVRSVLGQQVVQVVQELMWPEERTEWGRIQREGLVHILNQPEFAQAEDMQQVIDMLEHPPLLRSILEGVRQEEGVQVFIGGEGRHELLRDVSLVLSSYGVSSKVSGVLGVLGPVRMSYSQTIPLVRYVAQLMSDMIREW